MDYTIGWELTSGSRSCSSRNATHLSDDSPVLEVESATPYVYLNIVSCVHPSPTGLIHYDPRRAALLVVANNDPTSKAYLFLELEIVWPAIGNTGIEILVMQKLFCT